MLSRSSTILLRVLIHYKIKKNHMKINNKTVLIVGLVILSGMGIIFQEKDLALAIGSGLVGYLSKDVSHKKK